MLSGTIEQRTRKHIRAAVYASEQRIVEQPLMANVALLAQLQGGAATTVATSQHQSISPRHDTGTGGWQGGHRATCRHVERR
jgi:hypothetical protein